MFTVYALVIIYRYFGPSCLGAEFVGAELVRGRVGSGQSLLGAEMSSYRCNTCIRGRRSSLDLPI